MAHEMKFFNMAVCESNAADDSGPDEKARILLMGSIGMFSHTRSEFLKNADEFLDVFNDSAECIIQRLLEEETLTEDGDKFDEVIECISIMAREIDEVDRKLFIKIAGDDWDERQKENHVTH